MKAYIKIFNVLLIVGGQLQIANCQLLTGNNIGMAITGGIQLTVKGDIQNNTGTTIDNNGIIDLTGNWIHNAGNNCFGTSTGTVIFNGANQTIGGTNSTTFNNLQLAGSGIKTLLQNTFSGGANAIPLGVLDLTTRTFDLNSNRITITNSNTNAIGFTTGYILSEDVDNSSKVTWQINSTTGVHTIPFGTGLAVQIPFTYNLTSGNAGDVTVSTYPSAPNNAPYPVTPILVTHVRNNFNMDNSINTVDRFWEVDATGNPVAALTFTYATAENAAAGNTNVRAQHWSAPFAAWDTPLAGQINPTSQSVFVPNVTQFGPWALALEASPLPVELLFFTAIPVDNKEILCSWTTASEINNDFFTVERSKDGNEFNEVGKVDGAGNSTTTLNYSFTDKNPYSGISYYRLKQTDFNGFFSYSQIVPVRLAEKNNYSASIFPNPASSHFFIQINSTSINLSQTIFELFDASGRKISGRKLSEMKSFSESIFEFERGEIADGIYFYRIISDKQLIMNGKIEMR